MSPTSLPGVAVIFSTPMTSAKRPRPDSRKSRAPYTAADPEAQAFSNRVIGLKRRSGRCCSTSDAGKARREKAVVEQADEGRIDLMRLDAGIGDGGAGDPADEGLDIR